MQDKLSEMFGELATFESDIRAFIADTLKEIYSLNWLKTTIPKSMIDDWKQKKENDVKQGKIPEGDLIKYADFSQYKEIMLHNWKCFSPYFEDKEKLRVRLDDLANLCRNVTMHNRTLTEDEIGMGRVSLRWLRSRMEGKSSVRKEGIREVEEIHPIFRANPFMVEEGASLVRGEKRPSEETLKHIDLQFVDHVGKPLFVEIKWASIDENQVSEYGKLIGSRLKDYRLMWMIPDNLSSAQSRLEQLGAEVKIFSKQNMSELVEIRRAATQSILDIKETLSKPFEYAIQTEKVTFEDVIRACYFDGAVSVDGRSMRVGLKQSAIGRYLDLIRCIISSPYADSLPELTLEFVRDILTAPYSYKHRKFINVAQNGFASIPKVAHVHSSLITIINGISKQANDYHSKYKNRVRALYQNDIRKYDLTYRILEKVTAGQVAMLDVKTLVGQLVGSLVMSPLRPTPRVFLTTLNQWAENSVETSGYENDFAKRIVELATLKRILIPQRGITIMWVLVPRQREGKLEVDRVPCQSFIFNRDPSLYLEAI